MKLACSVCGWNEASVDLHHIIPRIAGGSDLHTNITALCPNHHRLAHSGLLTTFMTLDEQIGDTWKNFYFPERCGFVGTDKKTKKQLAKLAFRAKCKLDIENKIALLHAANIEFTKLGWCEKAAAAIGIAPQHIRLWIYKNIPGLVVYSRLKQK